MCVYASKQSWKRCIWWFSDRMLYRVVTHQEAVPPLYSTPVWQLVIHTMQVNTHSITNNSSHTLLTCSLCTPSSSVPNRNTKPEIVLHVLTCTTVSTLPSRSSSPWSSHTAHLKRERKKVTILMSCDSTAMVWSRKSDAQEPVLVDTSSTSDGDCLQRCTHTYTHISLQSTTVYDSVPNSWYKSWIHARMSNSLHLSSQVRGCENQSCTNVQR